MAKKPAGWLGALGIGTAILASIVILHPYQELRDPLPHTGAVTAPAVPIPGKLARHIEEQCQINGVNPAIIFAIIDRESNFQTNVTNHTTGCAGLMQLSPDTVEWLELQLGTTCDPYDPYDNTTHGIYLVGWLLKRYNYYVPSAMLAYAEGYGEADAMLAKGVDPVQKWQYRTIAERMVKNEQ